MSNVALHTEKCAYYPTKREEVRYLTRQRACSCLLEATPLPTKYETTLDVRSTLGLGLRARESQSVFASSVSGRSGKQRTPVVMMASSSLR
jgi:hypothetical protein